MGDFPNLFIGYFGETDATFSQPFRGAVIAPNGRVVLQAVAGEGHQGAFFAKEIEVQPYSLVTYVAPGEPYGVSLDPSQQPPAGDPCADGMLNQTETDIDCGGESCAPCLAGAQCAQGADCSSGICRSGLCQSVSEPGCNLENALDLGGPGSVALIANDSCIKIQDGYPSWWGESRTMQLQTLANVTSSVGFTWSNQCNNSQGSGFWAGAWSTEFVGPTSSECATLVSLEGDGEGVVEVRYY